MNNFELNYDNMMAKSDQLIEKHIDEYKSMTMPSSEQDNKQLYHCIKHLNYHVT